MRVMFLVLAACGGNPTPTQAVVTNAAPESDDVVITLARTACLGYCPEYEIAITETGRVRYTGKDAVKTMAGESKLSRDTLAKLLSQFAKWDELPSNMEGTVTDAPNFYLTYRGKQIHYSPGIVVRGSKEDVQRRTVDALADAVDKAVDIEKFIGTDQEREAMEYQERLERAREACDRRTGQARTNCYDDHAVPVPP